MTSNIVEIPADEITSKATEWIKGQIVTSIEEKGHCILGLAGGSTPGPIYEQLGNDKSIEWAKVTIFLVDDRYIAADHKDSNQNLVNNTLLKNGDIPKDQIFFPNATLKVEDCIKDYSDRLGKLFHDKGYPDICILGIGPDGHIASLFPPLGPQAFDDKHNVLHTTTTQFAVFDRITVTLPILEKSKKHVFLLKGKDKLQVWQQMTAEPNKKEQWPAQALTQHNNVTVLVGL